MKTNKAENEPRLLPIIRFDDAEFLVDIDRQQFKEAHKQNIIVPFHSQEGRKMLKARQDAEYTMQNRNQEREDNVLKLYAEHLQREWQAEIKRAIDRIKHPRSEWDKSFRKQWHKAKWKRIHGWSRFAKDEQTDIKVG